MAAASSRRPPPAPGPGPRAVKRAVCLRRTVAFLEKPTDAGYDRHWKLEIRGAPDPGAAPGAAPLPLERLVKRIHVQLHETFQPPTQLLTTPPFVVERDGYASFDLELTFYFAGHPDPIRLRYDMDVSTEGVHESTHVLRIADPSPAFLDRLAAETRAAEARLPTPGKSTTPSPTSRDERTSASARWTYVRAPRALGVRVPPVGLIRAIAIRLQRLPCDSVARRRRLAERLAQLSGRGIAIDATRVVRDWRARQRKPVGADAVRVDAHANAVTFDLRLLDDQALDELSRLAGP